ncbi:MAG: hypothetical protein AAGH87_03440 [Pseudomonadota bacterium]
MARRARRYAGPLGIAFVCAVAGRRLISHGQEEFGIWADILGIAIVGGGILVALWLWRRGRA